MLENTNEKIIAENEEINSPELQTEITSPPPKKPHKRKVIVIASLILVAVLALSLLFVFQRIKEKNQTFKVDSIEWNISAKQLKKMCDAELIEETENSLSYKYADFENLVKDVTAHYFFEDDKLISVRITSDNYNDALAEKVVMRFNAEENVSYVHTKYYSNYDGYHMYVYLKLENTRDPIDANVPENAVVHITKERVDNSNYNYPRAYRFFSDDEIEDLLDKADSLLVTDLSSITAVDEFKKEFEKYTDTLVQLSDAHRSYPDNRNIESTHDYMYSGFEQWYETAYLFYAMVPIGESENYKTWRSERLDAYIDSK